MSKAESGKRKAVRKKPEGEAPPEFELADDLAGGEEATPASEPAESPDQPLTPSPDQKMAWDSSGDPISDLDAAAAMLTTLEVPIGQLPPGYVSQHVDVHVSRGQGQILKRLLAGLIARHARLPREPHLPHARFVQTNADAVRWLLEEIGRREGEGVKG